MGSGSVGGRHRWLDRRALHVPEAKNAGPYLHRTANRAKGPAYRGFGRHPSTTVDDSVLADRIRSTIGPLEKELHISRINLAVENGVAILHSEVESPDTATQIEEAVRGVAGDIRSHLSD